MNETTTDRLLVTDVSILP